MKRKAGYETKPDSFEDYIFQNALNKAISLDADPTTAGNQLPSDGDIGYNGAKLFINLGGTVIKFTGTAV